MRKTIKEVEVTLATTQLLRETTEQENAYFSNKIDAQKGINAPSYTQQKKTVKMKAAGIGSMGEVQRAAAEMMRMDERT